MKIYKQKLKEKLPVMINQNNKDLKIKEMMIFKKYKLLQMRDYY